MRLLLADELKPKETAIFEVGDTDFCDAAI